MCRKSQKISTASEEYFLSYVKKKLQGGVKLTPPIRRHMFAKSTNGTIRAHYNKCTILHKLNHKNDVTLIQRLLRVSNVQVNFTWAQLQAL